MNAGLAALVALLLVLVAVALRQRQDFGVVLRRFIEQFAVLVPRMICALVAAGFIARMIPRQAVAGLLGPEAGLLALPVATAAGLLVPGGPPVTFAMAAVFAKSGASTAALVSFVTSWSIFTAHRIFIYEVPLLGPSFVRLRLVSAMALPLVAGFIAYGVGFLTAYGAAVPIE